MRSERQTVRRLAHSGVVLFTVRTYLTPVEELGKEAGVPERLVERAAELAGGRGGVQGAVPGALVGDGGGVHDGYGQALICIK